VISEEGFDASGFAVHAEGIGVDYGSVRALDGVEFAIPAGSSVALLGPNGSGKSTLLEVIAGLIRPDRGSVQIGPGRVALVPQGLEIEPAFPVTVEDVVRMGRFGELGALRRFAGRDHELVEEAIAALDVAHIRGRRFGTLSGGERQRALLAQAVATDARLLLLDEPLTGVDAPTAEAIGGLLARLAAERRTILVATHDLQSARREYSHVLCLNGSVIAFGPPEQTCTEEVLSRTFEGRTVRVGDMLIDVAHHHHGAG